MYETTLSDVHVGDAVRAFHPLTLGVVYMASVTKVGRKYVHVQFGIDGRRFHMLPKYITEVL